MSKFKLLLLCMLVATFLSPPVLCAGDSIDALLVQADPARSADPHTFEKLLAQLNEDLPRATTRQREHIAYLNAWEQAFLGNYDESINLANKLILQTPDVDLKFRAGALIVNSYAGNGRFNEGLAQLEKTLSLLDKVRDENLRQHGLLAAATLYNEIGQYKLGLRYAEMVIPSPASGRWLCFANYLKFNALLNLRQSPKDDEPVINAVNQCSEQHEVVMANMIRVGLTKKWILEGNKERALGLLKQYLAQAKSTRYPRVISEFESQLAQLLFAKGEIDEAEIHAQAAVSQSSEIINTSPVVSAFLTLYRVADRRNDPVAALAYYKRYADANKAFLTEVKARDLAYQIVKQQAAQKNQQIELLDRQNRVLQLQQQVDRQSAQNSRLLMLVFALGAALVAFWAYKTKRMHASLKRMAETDALTGVFNRHHFTLQAEKCLAECALAGEPASLLMFDLDHFKTINDSYGHSTGDWVLRKVTDTCQPFCRRMDHFGRIGGEEFSILLHGVDLHAATRLAEDVRVKLATINTQDCGYKFTVTGSFGVSASSLSGYDLAKLLAHADLMLYRAKREGRNRVRTYAPDMPITLRPQALEAELAAVPPPYGDAAESPAGT